MQLMKVAWVVAWVAAIPQTALEGVRPSLAPGDVRLLAAPRGPCPPKGFDAPIAEAKRAQLIDAGVVDLALTRSGCSRLYLRPPNRHEYWKFEGKRGVMAQVSQREPDGTIVEGRDTNADGVIDYEEFTRFDDAGEVQSKVTFSYPYDGGHAGRQFRSLALGGDKRNIEDLLWRDGGWVLIDSHPGTWIQR